ncbi:MAG: hypothetical protein RM049_13290 [Nostoc sp. DedQUE04]|uniref:hypothetical protein n=1 Tax=Nostoc sp. DedQUE04 TaxID=3075390 RepID=UPI002AD3497E|nr:hypothetical protein [Nostoc sp. DedQUE04]MDZ8136260.1 hypothetical protein [Nostoc sp. DedQUE04]
MTTIYLHIGMPKTGTTCLQKALFNNRDKFLENGYLYPMCGIKHNAKEIVNRYCHNTLAHCLMGLEDKDNTLSISIWEELKTEIDFINPKNVIISAEAFTSFEIFYQPETLAKIKDLLKEYEIKVVIYLRKQDDFLESSYCYMVKLGACSVGIKELFNEYQYIFNYYQILENWADIFGYDNMIVRLFAKSNTKNHIFADFLGVINQFNNKSDYKVDYGAKINVSPSGKTIKMLLLINNLNERVLARFIKLDDSYWSNYQNFMSFLSDNKTICKLVSMLPNVLIDDLLLLPKEKEDIMRQFQELNSQIAYKYLGQKDGVLFGDSS